ncbi:inovirus Gp2 family protein [Comamonas sp. SY3]|jgi:Inovirus Gp2|uniref:inovirus Gp2 family protein n=1 Tax=Comamonas TaxID=283 RepID=UPI0005BB3685
MKRNPLNTNHHLHHEPFYQGHEVQINHGPLIKENLARSLNCFEKALSKYPRVCSMRFDLHIPDNYFSAGLNDNDLINKFFSSLRSQIQSSQSRSRKLGNRVHDTDVRYTWGREVSSTGRVHYHINLLLNNDAYAHIGKFNLDNDNMYSRIHKAWASALGVVMNDLVGLIHIPQNPTYLITKDDAQSFDEAFFRSSYLCKLETKEFGHGFHTFGCSRI